MENKPVLALYNCRSKQDYIYRTNRIREISGGSDLLANLFDEFFKSVERTYFINLDWKDNHNFEGDFIENFINSGKDGEIVYDGGGNLFVIYRSEEVYRAVNRKMSYYAIEKTYTISIVASFTEVTGNFVEDRKKIYIENARNKNTGMYNIPCNALPFTQRDRVTHMPIVKKDKDRDYSRESMLKDARFDNINKSNIEILSKELDEMVEKVEDSLLAVIYIDGNNMGNKVKKITEGVKSNGEEKPFLCTSANSKGAI